MMLHGWKNIEDGTEKLLLMIVRDDDDGGLAARHFSMWTERERDGN